MHARTVSTLLVLFAFSAVLPLAAAQTSPNRSHLTQQTPDKLLPSKPLPFPAATQIVPLPSQIGSADNRTITPQELETWTGALQNQKDGLAMSMQKFGGGPDAPKCAHIRIIQAPEMDSEMVVRVSPGDGGPIQTFQGLPPCRRDLPAPMTVQRLYGVPPMPSVPRRPFVQPPGSQIPSSQPQSSQPKTEVPSAKP